MLALSFKCSTFWLEMSLVSGTDIVIQVSCHLGMVFGGLTAPQTAILMCISLHYHM